MGLLQVESRCPKCKSMQRGVPGEKLRCPYDQREWTVTLPQAPSNNMPISRPATPAAAPTTPNNAPPIVVPALPALPRPYAQMTTDERKAWEKQNADRLDVALKTLGREGYQRHYGITAEFWTGHRRIIGLFLTASREKMAQAHHKVPAAPAAPSTVETAIVSLLNAVQSCLITMQGPLQPDTVRALAELVRAAQKGGGAA